MFSVVPNITVTDARTLLGWTQSHLARRSGVPVSTLNEIESGDNRNPGYQVVMRIVKALQAGGLVGLTAEDVFPVVEPKAVAS